MIKSPFRTLVFAQESQFVQGSIKQMLHLSLSYCRELPVLEPAWDDKMTPAEPQAQYAEGIIRRALSNEAIDEDIAPHIANMLIFWEEILCNDAMWQIKNMHAEFGIVWGEPLAECVGYLIEHLTHERE